MAAGFPTTVAEAQALIDAGLPTTPAAEDLMSDGGITATEARAMMVAGFSAAVNNPLVESALPEAAQEALLATRNIAVPAGGSLSSSDDDGMPGLIDTTVPRLIDDDDTADDDGMPGLISTVPRLAPTGIPFRLTVPINPHTTGMVRRNPPQTGGVTRTSVDSFAGESDGSMPGLYSSASDSDTDSDAHDFRTDAAAAAAVAVVLSRESEQVIDEDRVAQAEARRLIDLAEVDATVADISTTTNSDGSQPGLASDSESELYGTMHQSALDSNVVEPSVYGARFPAEIYTRGCHWIPRMFA
jgi:hypothetical protein